jgi:hypothetical protein
MPPFTTKSTRGDYSDQAGALLEGGLSDMPKPLATLREDQVIDLVLTELRRSGRSVDLLDRPDRNNKRDDGLTVDAEVLVDKEQWALDVTTLRWYPRLEGDVQRITKRLEKEVGSQLRDMNRTLVLTCHVSSDKNKVNSIIELAVSAVNSGEDRRRGDEVAVLCDWSPALGAVEVQPWLGQCENVREEVVRSFGKSLANKLQGQFSRARELGYRTCLVIDQHGPPGTQFGANFLPLPGTIITAVEQVEARMKASIDLLILVPGDDTVQWLRS